MIHSFEETAAEKGSNTVSFYSLSEERIRTRHSHTAY